MKYFLDSAKLDEIQTAYNTFGIDGVTTNPRHIMLSGKPFLTAIQGIADWIKSEGLDGYERFPVSVEINPHLDEAEAMLAEARKIAAISPNFVIKIPATEAGVTAARKLEAEGIRTNVTLVFSPAQAILPAKNHSLFVSPFMGWSAGNCGQCSMRMSSAGRKPTERTVRRISGILWTFTRTTVSMGRPRSSARPSGHRSRLWIVPWPGRISLQPGWLCIRIP